MAATLTDSYAETNHSGNRYLGGNVADGWSNAQLQAFTCDHTGTVDSAKFYMMKTGSPTGNVYAKIYAHTGSYGSTSAKTGDALATSAAVSAATVGGSYGLITFTFDNTVTLTSGNHYCLAIEYSGGDASNYLRVSNDNSAPEHDGDWAYYRNHLSNWANGGTSYDMVFYVYVTEAAGVNATVTVNEDLGVAGGISIMSTPHNISTTVNYGTGIAAGVGITATWPATLSAPTNVMGAIINSDMDIQVSWQHDSIATAASFQVQRSLNGGAWTDVT